jgi:hypothetical protein
MSPQQVVDLIFSWLAKLIGYAFVLIIFAALAQRFGLRIPYVPVIDHVAIAYLAGGWYLSRK